MPEVSQFSGPYSWSLTFVHPAANGYSEPHTGSSEFLLHARKVSNPALRDTGHEK